MVQTVGIHQLMRSMIDALERAFVAYDERIDIIPPRDGFSYDEPYPGLIEWMPSLKRGGSATLKMVGYHPHNPVQHELPTIVSSIGVYDVSTGHLKGLLDGTFLTALRTGAASALASKVLARPDSRIVGLVGAGAQAVTQLHALATLFELEQVYVYDIDSSAAESFIHRTAFLKLPVSVVRTGQLEGMVSGVDILVTATSTEVGAPPVIPDVETRPWLHINAIGSDFPGKTEMPRALLERAFVVPDFPEQAQLEGECQQLPPDRIGPALHLLIKDPAAYADRRDHLTVFDSTGWALEDAVAAQLMLDLVREQGLGRDLAIQHMPTDPMNPYDFSR
ncbi:MAG: ornithine cyclodeaminase family protein [Chloroflexi bacterium]|nr:ornithine cyclodeaminase family protein [Chloroflexota bacterium]